jgi:drug/metabolite transporter (DMT)-like permease
VRPGPDGFQPAVLWVLASVAGVAVRDIASRRVPWHYSSAQISAWGVMAVALTGAAMMLASGQAVLPGAWQGLQLLCMTAFGTFGYWAVTAATRLGEISVVAPFRYARLVFAIVIGWTVFDERVDAVTLAGAALIIGSGLYAFARERARKRALPMTPAAG